MKILIKQTIILPALFFIPVFVSGYLVDGYNPISQHASEITLTKFETPKAILNIGAILTGLSCILFAFGTLLLSYKRLLLSSILIFIFGISMISNGLFPMGNPMHGFYGIGLSLIMLPFVCCYEMKNVIKEKRFFRLSIFSGIIIFIYFWSMLIGLDPENYRGLTQRLASVVIFGWIAYAAHAINKNSIEVSTITT
jgi:hypothetical membrane protein